jgi:hypothetical protein
MHRLRSTARHCPLQCSFSDTLPLLDYFGGRPSLDTDYTREIPPFLETEFYGRPGARQITARKKGFP